MDLSQVRKRRTRRNKLGTVIHTLVTHARPHWDEYVAWYLLKFAGEQLFPGIGNARHMNWENLPEPKLTADEYELQGYLCIGVGGGRFDEHPTMLRPRIADECAATLVAKELGLNEDPAWVKLLEFTRNVDLKGGQPFDAASLAKLMHEIYPENPEIVRNWAFSAIEAKRAEQQRFFAVAEEFAKVAELEEISGTYGKIRMVTAVSDSEQLGKYARSNHGARAGVVIQKTSTGNVQIFSNAQARLPMSKVAAAIRLAEQEAKGIVVTTDLDILESDGKVVGAEEWYFQSQGGMLLNGSTTARGVPPTSLTLSAIQQCVREALSSASDEATEQASAFFQDLVSQG